MPRFKVQQKLQEAENVRLQQQARRKLLEFTQCFSNCPVQVTQLKGEKTSVHQQIIALQPLDCTYDRLCAITLAVALLPLHYGLLPVRRVVVVEGKGGRCRGRSSSTSSTRELGVSLMAGAVVVIVVAVAVVAGPAPVAAAVAAWLSLWVLVMLVIVSVAVAVEGANNSVTVSSCSWQLAIAAAAARGAASSM